MKLKTFLVLREPTKWDASVEEVLLLFAEQIRRHFGEQLSSGVILRATNAEKGAIRTSGFLARRLRIGELKLPEWQPDSSLDFVLPQISLHAESREFLLVVAPEILATRLFRDFVSRICNINESAKPHSLNTCEAITVEIDHWTDRRATLKGRARVLFH